MTGQERKRLFPKGRKRAYVYTPEQLRAIYDRLPASAIPFMRFAVHTGMRLREITTLTWANVDLDGARVYVEARWGKGRDGGKARYVALGEVAHGVLDVLRPAEPAPTDHVFLGPMGGPIRARYVEEVFDRALLSESRRARKRKRIPDPVWRPSNADEKKPRFHDLRKTAATRVEAVSSHAVAKMFLGHADEDVTDRYVQPSLEDVRKAVNHAARSIDGQIPPGTIAFPDRPVTKSVTPPAGNVEISERSVSDPHG